MTFEADAAAATEDVIDALGDTATYLSDENGVATTVTGLFDRNPIIEETEDGSLLHYSAAFSMKASDLPTDYQEGDTLTKGGVDYMVRTIQIDGFGEARLLLSVL